MSQTGLYDVGSSRVGYIHFRNFVQPSVDALSSAFQQLKDQGASDLVLDLRYNGGGLVSVAQHLAGLIAGPPLVGKVFVNFTHNDKQTSRNTSYLFESKPQALTVPRLVVIATRGSASASEAIINGLRPYMDVKVVGDTTYGKPVGQYGFEFCDKVLYPVAFLVTNSRGQADYYSGIPADCAAADDVDHALADAREGSLAEALTRPAHRPLQRTGRGRAGPRSRACARTSARSRGTAGARRSTPGERAGACYHPARLSLPEPDPGRRAPDSMSTPEKIGKYQIVGKLGQGAMGEVFRAHDPVLNRDVALKRISAGLDADETVRRRFLREAQVVASLSHKNIVIVYELGFEGDQAFMAMELLEGKDLKHAIATRKMSLDEKVSVMEQTAEGLAYAHAREIVHRDLKPANIHILPGDKVKVMDFGLTRMPGSDMTSTGTVMGTPHYMSPEQVRGQKADARSDVFALGCIFYELLTGKKPFDAESMHGVLFKVMQEEPAPLARAHPGAAAGADAGGRAGARKGPRGALPERGRAAGGAAPGARDGRRRPRARARRRPAAHRHGPPRRAADDRSRQPVGDAAGAAARPPRRRRHAGDRNRRGHRWFWVRSASL